MEFKEIKTPGGYDVTLKSDLTYGEYQDIQALMASNIELDPETGKPAKFDFDMIQKANQKALETIVVKIDLNGLPYSGNIRDLPAKDGKFIQAEVDKILKENSDDTEIDGEKKGIE